MKITIPVLALLLVSSLVTSAAARPRTKTVSALAQSALAHSSPAYSNAMAGRQIAAPPWSAACMTDHGPSECGEPMWIYGPRDEIARYRSAF